MKNIKTGFDAYPRVGEDLSVEQWVGVLRMCSNFKEDDYNEDFTIEQAAALLKGEYDPKYVRVHGGYPYKGPSPVVFAEEKIHADCFLRVSEFIQQARGVEDGDAKARALKSLKLSR